MPMKFKLLVGLHFGNDYSKRPQEFSHPETGELQRIWPQKPYHAGDIVLSEEDLVKKHGSEKFQLIEDTAPPAPFTPPLQPLAPVPQPPPPPAPPVVMHSTAPSSPDDEEDDPVVEAENKKIIDKFFPNEEAPAATEEEDKPLPALPPPAATTKPSKTVKDKK